MRWDDEGLPLSVILPRASTATSRTGSSSCSINAATVSIVSASLRSAKSSRVRIATILMARPDKHTSADIIHWTASC
eukprot:498416-Rhodomonas_salina.1